MPPRSSLTSSFSVTDANNEVVCPLRNQDGSSCRKRCIGEKRYRSMQEHIRRAHPEHYISKLPATEESFQLMINTPPSERPVPQPSSNNPPTSYGHERYGHEYFGDDSSAPNTPRNLDEYTSSSMLPAVSAAATLAQLHNHKVESDWDSEVEWMSDTEAHTKAMRSSIELPPISRPNIREPTSEPFPSFTSNGLHPSPSSNRPRDVYHNQSHLSSSPPGRSSTLPPLQRHSSGTRPRKQSVSKRAKEPAHRRQKSREQNSREQYSREQIHMRRMSYDRKAFSAEPSSGLGTGYGNLGSLAQQAVYGKRWEDLIDAATSATEDVEEERTPIPQSPQIPSSPINRLSLPPFSASHFQGYQASPLQRALTPPDYNEGYPAERYVPASFPSVDTLPSVESAESAEGGNFHMDSRGLSSSGGVGMAHSLSSQGQSSHGPSNSTSSYALSDAARRISDSQNMSDSTNPNRLSGVSENSTFSTSGTTSGQNIQIYCAACQGICLLKESYACTECICGICRICVDVLVGNPAAGNLGKSRGCPRCETVGGRYKRFALEFR